MFRNHKPQTMLSPSGFFAPPGSRPPTKAYDRLSHVLVVTKNDDVLKFMKVHLNRYFSHVLVYKSYTEGFAALKEKIFDLAIVQANPKLNPTIEFLRRMGSQHRDVPTIVMDLEAESTIENYSGPVVLDVISPPFDLDKLHLAIRRALSIRAQLKTLSDELPPRSNFAELIRGSETQKEGSKHGEIIESIRKTLKEDAND